MPKTLTFADRYGFEIPDIDDDVDDDHDSNYDPNEDSESDDDESAMSYASSLASSDNGDSDDSDYDDDGTAQPMPGLSAGVDGDDDDDDKHDDDSNSARSTESTPTIKEEEDEASVENQTPVTIIKPNLETEAQGTEQWSEQFHKKNAEDSAGTVFPTWLPDCVLVEVNDFTDFY
jgi:hypothetical protein